MIAITDSTADDKKGSVVICTTKDFDDLALSLLDGGFKFNIFSFYLRFVMRNLKSIEGKWYVQTSSVEQSCPEI